jgi:hypothetical protein
MDLKPSWHACMALRDNGFAAVRVDADGNLAYRIGNTEFTYQSYNNDPGWREPYLIKTEVINDG